MNTRLAIAVLLPFVACVVQWLLWDIFKPYAWFLFIPTVFLSAWVGGFVGGLVATVMGSLLAWYIFIPPVFSFSQDNPASVFSIVIFIFTGCLFSFFFDQLQRSKRRANEALATAESANEKTSQHYQKLKEAQRLARCWQLGLGHPERYAHLVGGGLSHLWSRPSLASSNLPGGTGVFHSRKLGRTFRCRGKELVGRGSLRMRCRDSTPLQLPSSLDCCPWRSNPRCQR